MKISPTIKRVLQALFLVCGLGFFIALFASQWQELNQYDWHLSLSALALSLVLLFAGWFLEINVWRFILNRLHADSVLRPLRAWQIWFLSNIVRYIPGNIWQFISMVSLTRDEKIPPRASLTSIVLHQVLLNLSGLLLAALLFAWYGHFAILRSALPLALMLPAIAILNPPWLERFLNWVLRRLGREPLVIALTWREMVVLLACYLLVWVLMGAGFAALSSGLTAMTFLDWPYLISSFAAAYVLGYLSLITPSGLGVREGVLVLLLTPIMPAGVAAAVAIIARLWIMVGEVIGAGSSLMTWPRGRQWFRRQPQAME